MLSHPPKLPYSGLTIVLSNPSRFDITSKKLLSANGGLYLTNECLYPLGVNRFQCDIRELGDERAILPNTYCILALGERAQQVLGRVQTSLGEQRGSPVFFPNKPTVISSYLPQDAVEMKDLEGDFNPLLQGFDENDEDDSGNEKSRHGKTNRKNWAFWLKKDVEKAVTLTLNKGKLPSTYDPTKTCYHIFPPAVEVISALSSRKGLHLFFDIETDANLNIIVFAFGWDLNDVWVVPVLDWNYSLAYGDATYGTMRALGLAIRDNTLVAHNGAGFDFLVLAHKYKIAIGKNVYDTMLAQNRIYPEAEKSLGHCISLPWMWEPYHKDEGNFAYRSSDQAMQLWRYCGKDVSSLVRLHGSQSLYARSISGLWDSIEDVNSFVRPYLTSILQGIRFDEQKRLDIIEENDRLMNQYLRFLDMLVGEENLLKIKGSGKSAMPGSSKQCATYFHKMLGYPVQGKSAKTGEPSLDAKACFKLKLALKTLGVENPVIDIVLAYRARMKESGMLKFNPWRVYESM